MVERYYFNSVGEANADESGGYVLFEDYAELEKQRDELQGRAAVKSSPAQTASQNQNTTPSSPKYSISTPSGSPPYRQEDSAPSCG